MLEKIPETLGKALLGFRAGIDQTLYERQAHLPDTIELASPAFAEGDLLDPRFTEDGDGRSPPLRWSGVPADARELVLLVEDADSPSPKPIVHLVVHGLRGEDGALPEGAASSGGSGLLVGRNTFGKRAWLPPDPPTGHGSHRYCFQLFALAAPSELGESAGRTALSAAVAAHGIARGRVIAVYQRG